MDKAVRDGIIERDGRCLVCGTHTSPDRVHHVHHIHTRGSGGDDSPQNLITLCDPCHKQIHTTFVTLHNSLPIMRLEVTSAVLRWILKTKYDYSYTPQELGKGDENVLADLIRKQYDYEVMDIW